VRVRAARRAGCCPGMRRGARWLIRARAVGHACGWDVTGGGAGERRRAGCCAGPVDDA